MTRRAKRRDARVAEKQLFCCACVFVGWAWRFVPPFLFFGGHRRTQKIETPHLLGESQHIRAKKLAWSERRFQAKTSTPNQSPKSCGNVRPRMISVCLTLLACFRGLLSQVKKALSSSVGTSRIESCTTGLWKAEATPRRIQLWGPCACFLFFSR